MSTADRLEVAPSWGRRLDGIEGLRGVAALSVMVAHTIILLRVTDRPAPALGSITGLLLHGLTLFFVLSGFLLYRAYAAAVVSGRTAPSPRDFLRNRVLRIWPAYLVILAVVGFVLGTAVTKTTGGGPIGGSEDQFGYLTDPLLLLVNVFLVQGWFPHTVFTGLSVSWSLVPEVSFYLLLPLLGALAVRLARRRNVAMAVAVPALLLLAVGVTGRIISLLLVQAADPSREVALQFGPTWNTVLYRSVLSQGDLFAMGMLAAVAVTLAGRSGAGARRAIRRTAWAAVTVGVLGVVAIRSGELVTPFMGLFCAGTVTLLRLPEPGRLPRLGVTILEFLPLRLAGLCSYSVYLWHFPVIWWLRIHADASTYATWPGLLVSLALVATLTLILASITYRWVELPAMRRKRRTDRGTSEKSPSPAP